MYVYTGWQLVTGLKKDIINTFLDTNKEIYVLLFTSRGRANHYILEY